MKTFPLHAFLALVTSRMWLNFGDVHALAEHVMGHPIWTHEFGSEALWVEMRRRVLLSHPGLADLTPDECVTSPEDAAPKLAAQVARFGVTLDIVGGADVRTKSPMETAAEMMGADRVLGIRVGSEDAR